MGGRGEGRGGGGHGLTGSVSLKCNFFLYVLPIGIREGVNKNKELKDSEISAQENNYLVAKYVVF